MMKKKTNLLQEGVNSAINQKTDNDCDLFILFIDTTDSV